MGKRKNALKREPMKPWESATPDDCHEQYLRIGRTALTNPAITELPLSYQMVFVHMAQACAGKKRFTFSVGECDRRGIPKNTFYRARSALEAAGIIQTVVNNKTTRQPNIYEWQINFWKKVEREEE